MERIDENGSVLSSLYSEIGAQLVDFFSLKQVDLTENEIQCFYFQPKADVNLDSLRKKLNSFLNKYYGTACFILVSKIPYKNGEVDQEKLREIYVIDNVLLKQCNTYLSENDGNYRAEIIDASIERNEHYVDALLKIGNTLQYCDISSDLLSETEPEETKKYKCSESQALLNGLVLDMSKYPSTLNIALEEASNNPDGKIIFIEAENNRITETYASVFLKSRKYLGYLQSRGLKKDSVAILSLDCGKDFVIAFWACILGGIIPLPIPSIKSFDENDEVLNLFPSLKEQLKVVNIISKSSVIEKLGNCLESYFGFSAQCFPLDSLESYKDTKNFPILSPSDRALMLVTSGSTGKPKIVVHTHQSILARSAGTILHNKFTKADITLNWFAFDHVGALVMFHIRDVLLACTQVHILTSHILENPLRWINYINEYRVNVTWAPSFAYELIVSKWNRETSVNNYDLSCVKFILNGGEAINVVSTRRFLTTLADYHLNQAAMHPAWGMSETASGVVYSNQFSVINTNDYDQYANIGFPIPGCSIRVVDNNNQILYRGDIGKLQVKSLSLMQGYLQDINNGKSSFTKDGWFDTGDRAVLTNSGLKIVGRDKDIVIIYGKNYSCVDIEHLIQKIDNIVKTSVSVIPIREINKSAETIIAFIAIEDSVYIKDTLRNIRNAIVKYTGSFPEYLLILNELEFPRTTIGKIRKEELKKSFLGNQYIEQMEQYDKLFKQTKFIPDWFYESIWYRKKLANYSKKSIGKVLIFLEASERNTTLIYYLASYFDCLFVICGNEYRECNDSFIIDIHRPGDFVNIFYKLTQEDQINQIIYLNSKVFNINDQLVEKSVQLHIESLIYLYRAICQFLKQDVCFIYLNIIQAWKVIDYVYDGISAPAIALLKSFQAENNKFHFKSISIERLLDKVAIDIILKELYSPISESEVLLYKNDRYVIGLKSLSVEYPIKESFFKPNGFYIITGGFGAIGYEIAKLLVDKFSIDILLLGRKNFGQVPDANEKLAYLQRANNKIFYENADVCNQELLQDLVDRYSKLFDKPLNIIFHTAGIFKLHTLDSLTQQDIYQYTNSKIIGTINLLKVCQQYSKARLINFSSVNGFFGGANAALYAAANAFQDAMAHYQKKGNVVTLSWSMWKKFGMSSHVNFEELTKSRGFEVLDIEQGLGSFLLALHTNKPNILIGLNGNNRFINQYNNCPVINLEAVVYKTSYKSSSFKINDGFGHKVLVKNELLTQNSKLNGKLPKKQDNIAKLQEIWKKLLELDDVDLEDNFFDLGGHSLLIPPLQAELKTQLNLDVKAVDLFKYPTITYFADQFFKNNKLNDSDNVSSLVIHIWKEKLELDDIGYQDNFFELGAHSLMIPAVQAALNNYFDIKLNIVDIFKHPNVNSLSQHISQLLISKGPFSASLHEDIEKLRDRKKGFLGLQKKLIDEKII